MRGCMGEGVKEMHFSPPSRLHPLTPSFYHLHLAERAVPHGVLRSDDWSEIELASLDRQDQTLAARPARRRLAGPRTRPHALARSPAHHPQAAPARSDAV